MNLEDVLSKIKLQSYILKISDGKLVFWKKLKYLRKAFEWELGKPLIDQSNETKYYLNLITHYD